MHNNIMISLDWDHTLRNMDGIDLNILALAFYAKSKNIPIGLTTHRDRENTTLYTFYHWQYEVPQDNHAALAAAISYWNVHLFQPLDLKFDFINARYQPRYGKTQYYESALYPLEQKLAEEIIVNRVLETPSIVQEKIHQYAQLEDILENNEFKETQLSWLAQNFSDPFNPITIYHIDDNAELCQELPARFLKLAQGNNTVKTIFYASSPLFTNEGCSDLFTEIGILDDMRDFIHHPEKFTELHQAPLRCLSLCLCVSQIPVFDKNIVASIEMMLAKTKAFLTPETTGLHRFIETLLQEMKTIKQPICIMPNSLSLKK